MRAARLQALTTKLLVAALLVAGLNSVLLFVLLARGGVGTSGSQAASQSAIAPGPAAVQQGDSLGRPADPSPFASRAPDDVKGWFDMAIQPLDKAVVDYGEDPAEILPSGEEVAAAAQTETFDSDASNQVLDKLRAGYARFGMVMPALPTQGDASGAPSP